MRLCRGCGENKTEDDFFPSFRSRCKDCVRAYRREWARKNPEKVRAQRRRWYHRDVERSREQQREWRAKNPDKVAARLAKNREKAKRDGRYALYRFGLTLTARRELEAAQDHRCAICRKPLPESKNCVDHDHQTGAIRGLLCGRCNSALGWYETHREGIASYLAGPHLFISKRQPPGLLETPADMRKVPKTHCRQGHPLTEENCYYRSDGTRRCRICAATKTRERWRAAHPDAPERPNRRKF